MKPSSFFITIVAVGLLSCEPSYTPTIAPKDATFNVNCYSMCGPSGQQPGMLIAIDFLGHQRQFSVCCEHALSLVAQLHTVKDFWCDNLDVPDRRIGSLTVGTTESELTKKRGATLNQGQGYVVFHCDGWLEELLVKINNTRCCPLTPPAATTTSPPTTAPTQPNLTPAPTKDESHDPYP